MTILTRRNAWILVGASVVGFGFGLYALTERIRAFNAEAGFSRVHIEPQLSREFTIGQYPPVRLTDHEDADGRSFLRLEFGGAARLIPVKRPPAKDIPTLGIYDDWAEVLALNEVVLDAEGDSVSKPGSERLWLVLRRTPEGFDPDTWGSVRRTEWVFDFLDLRPDGTVGEFARRWPRSNRAEATLREQVASGDERAARIAAIPVLEPRTPELAAAMHVIPKLNVPKHKFTDTALSARVLGWTMPVTMLSVITGLLGLAFAVAPRSPTR